MHVMISFLQDIFSFWIICSGCNLPFLLIFSYDLRKMTEESVQRATKKPFLIDDRYFSIFLVAISILLGPILSFLMIRNLIFTGRPINKFEKDDKID